MNIGDAVVDFGNTDPERLVFALSEGFRAKSCEIIDRKKLNFYYVETPTSQKCSEAKREISQQEFAAYEANNFTMYESIDREKPFSSRGITNQCKRLEAVRQQNINSWFLEVEIPQGNYSTNVTVPEVSSFFLFDGFNPVAVYGLKNRAQTVNTSFASRLYIWAWENPGTGRTTVYLEAKPINGQVVACPGCSIGHLWWKQANGYAEFKLVKSYVLFLEELKRSDDILRKISQSDKHTGI